MTTVNQPLEAAATTWRPLGARRLSGWGPALVSFALAVAYGLYIALRTYEVDLGVYLRLGGRYVFTSHLYSFVLPNTSLPFTYPPFAALLFAPWQRTFTSVGLVQAVWTMCNVAALVGVLVLSVRLVKPSLDRVATWRLALALSLPALLLNPVLITIGFGQVNLFVTFLVMWDLLSERRIGKRQMPLGVATGLAAAVKLTPLLFVPYLVLTRRWRGAVTCVLTFGACELVTFAVSPASSRAYWTKAIFKPGRAGDLSIVDNQNLWGGPRSVHARRPSRCRHAPVAHRDRRSRALAGGPGAPPVIPAPGRARSVRRPASSCPPSRGSITWSGSCRRSCGSPWHPTGPVGAAPRRRHGGPLLERTRLVGAVQEHVGPAPQPAAAHRRELVLLRHAALPGRRSRPRRPTTRRTRAASSLPGARS